MSRSPSPTGSVASYSSTMSRPAAPSKPAHLSSALTGTCGSTTLHDYTQTHQTGGSFTSALDTQSGTMGKAQFGFGYGGAVDSYTQTFHSGSDDEHSDDESSLATGLSRPTLRGRTHTAPSVSRVFSPTADQDAGDGTSRLVRNEPIAINGQGPSKVGKLRDLFEATSAAKAETPAPLSKQDTGHSEKGKPRISNTVRKLQAQLTGEQIDDDTWNMDQFQRHSQDASTQSFDASEYGTAKESLLKDALKMDAVVILPDAADTDLDAFGLDQRTISQSSSTGNLFTPKLNRSLMNQDRDDSTATIKPLQRHRQEPQTPMSANLQSSPQSASSNCFRLTSIFASSPKSSVGDNSASIGEQNGPDSPTRSSSSLLQPDLGSLSHSRDSDDEIDAEKSRDPSVLEAETDIQGTSQHLRANDGSCFDLDWRANVSPTKSRIADAPFSADALYGSPDIQPDFEQPLQSSTAEASSEQVSTASSDPVPSLVESNTSVTGGDSAPASTFSDQSRPASGSSRILRPGTGKAAVALFDFEGEATFNELSLVAGQAFEIINEELAGGWSLGVVWSQDEPPRRGLIPQGWYSLDPEAIASQLATQAVQTPVNASVTQSPPAEPVREVIAPVSRVEPPAQAAEKADKANKPIVEPNRELPLLEVAISTPPPTQTAAAPVSPSKDVSQDSPSPPSLAEEANEEPQELSPVAQNVQKRFALDSAAQERISNRPSESKIFSASQAERILQFEHLLAQSSNDKPPARQSIEGLPPLSPALQSLNQIIKPSTPPEHVQETPPPPPAPTGKSSIFGKKTFNRFASFVTSGAEDYVMSSADMSEDEQLRSVARKVSGSNTTTLGTLRDQPEEVEPTNLSQSSAQGGGEVRQHAIEADQNHHFVVAGPAGPKWKSKTPTFLVQVHHPEKRSKMNGMQEYTIYHVTSTFPAHDPRDENGFPIISDDESQIPYDPLGGPYPPGAQVTVVRRFTQFEWLYQALTRHFAALGIPPVPEKQYSGRFASDFIETRRADLEMWMSRLVRHPVLRYSEPLQFFLSCEDDGEWRARAAALLREDTQGGFFARTWHPDFNFDTADAAAEAESMEIYLKATEKTINGVGGDNVGKTGVLSSIKGHRDGNVQTSSTYRDMSYTLLRMLTGAGAGSNDSRAQESVLTHDVHGPPMGNIGKKGDSGATNEHGAWCWREACHDCTNLTSALQNTAESLQDVADLYDHHARETLLRQHERVKDVSRPHGSIHALLETHKTTLAKYRVANGDSDGDHSVDGKLHPAEAEKLAARCETVLNVTLSEMDRIHDERVEDWHALGRTFLDSEIELYEGILETLRAARLHYEPQYYDREVGTHVLASRYQPDLYRPRKPPAPLQMPSQAQVPSGGLGANVGMLLSQATGGVTRPASAAVYAEASVDASESTTPGSGISPSGFVSNLLARSKRSNSNMAAAAANSSQPPSSPNKTGSMFSEFTNLPLPTRGGAEPYSQAGATLKAISQKQQQDEQRSSYFSAIWR